MPDPKPRRTRTDTQVLHLPTDLHAILKRKAQEEGKFLGVLVREVLLTGMRVKRWIPTEPDQVTA